MLQKAQLKWMSLMSLAATIISLMVFLFMFDEYREIVAKLCVIGIMVFGINALIFIVYGDKLKAAYHGVLAIVLMTVSCLTAMGIAIMLMQGLIIFHPRYDQSAYQALKNNFEFSEVTIMREDGSKLTGWLKYNTKDTPNSLIIYFGDSSEDASGTCYDFMHSGVWRYFSDYNFLMIDYPGYGLSDGTPSDDSIYAMAEEVYDYACNLDVVDDTSITIMGYGLGSGAATYIASMRTVNGLVLIAPFDQGISLYNQQLDMFKGLMQFFTLYKFNNTKYASLCRISPLILASFDDEEIDYQYAVNLNDAFPNAPAMYSFHEIKHNAYFQQVEILEKIDHYLEEIER